MKDIRSVAKFRPLLSELDVDEILAALALVPASLNVLAVRKKLILFQRKVEAGFIKPSAVTVSEVPKRDISEELGLSEEEKAVWMEADMRRLLGEPQLTEKEIEAIKLSVRVKVSATVLVSNVSASASAPLALAGFSLPVDMGNPFAN